MNLAHGVCATYLKGHLADFTDFRGMERGLCGLSQIFLLDKTR